MCYLGSFISNQGRTKRRRTRPRSGAGLSSLPDQRCESFAVRGRSRLAQFLLQDRLARHPPAKRIADGPIKLLVRNARPEGQIAKRAQWRGHRKTLTGFDIGSGQPGFVQHTSRRRGLAERRPVSAAVSASSLSSGVVVSACPDERLIAAGPSTSRRGHVRLMTTARPLSSAPEPFSAVGY